MLPAEAASPTQAGASGPRYLIQFPSWIRVSWERDQNDQARQKIERFWNYVFIPFVQSGLNVICLIF